MFNRAERRKSLGRMKKRARKVFDWYTEPKKAERYANHMCTCSGPCCGNPRHWWKGKDKTTISEQKSDINFKEQLDG